LGVAIFAIGSEAIDDLDDPAGDLAELSLAEATGGAGGCAQTDARGYEGLLRVEGDAVLVAGDMRAAQSGLGGLTSHLFRAQVGEAEVVVGTARNDIDAALHQLIRHGSGVGLYGLSIDFERRVERL